MFFNRSARAFAAAGARKFKNLHAKSREFRRQKLRIEFRRRTRAQGVTKVRRSSAHVLQVVRHLPVISAWFLKALGACRAQNLRRISSKLLRFQPKFIGFCGKTRGKQRRRAQKTPRMLCIVHKQLVCVFKRLPLRLRPLARENSKMCTQNRANLDAKNCATSAPNTRARRNKGAMI